VKPSYLNNDFSVSVTVIFESNRSQCVKAKQVKSLYMFHTSASKQKHDMSDNRGQCT